MSTTVLLTIALALAISSSQGGVVYENKAPQPYAFGYQIKDGHGNSQMRHEVSDEWGNKKGSYGYTDAWGVYRIVDYVADKGGYRAWIRSNEPGTSNQSPASVKMQVEPSPVSAYKAPDVLKTPSLVAPSPVHIKAVIEPLDVAPRAVYAPHHVEPSFHGYESKSKAFFYAPKIIRKRIVRRKKIGKPQYVPSFARNNYDALPYGTKIVKPLGHDNLDLPLYKDK